LSDSRRVLKTRKDSDSHPPPLPGGGLPGMHRTLFQKKEKIQKSDFPDFPVDARQPKAIQNF